MNDPYKVLNIAPNATDDEVKHASITRTTITTIRWPISRRKR